METMLHILIVVAALPLIAPGIVLLIGIITFIIAVPFAIISNFINNLRGK